MQHRAIGVLAVAVLAGLTLTACEPAELVVTKTADTNDGRCDQDCSLREAVLAANARPGRDLVKVPSGTYRLTRAGIGEDAGATGDLDVTDDLVLQGRGASTTVIDGLVPGASVVRVLDVHAGTVSVRDLTLQHGRGEGGGANGGAVRNNAALELVDVVVRDSSAENSGGGIDSVPRGGAAVSLTLIRSTVAGNTNTEEGSGIRSGGRLVLIDSAVLDNHNNDGYGGGIYVSGTGEVLDSRIEGNTNLCGGGLYNLGDLVVRRTAVVENTAVSGPAGIDNRGTLVVSDSDVLYNRSAVGGGGLGNLGGSVRLERVTVAGNVAEDNELNDCGTGSAGGGLLNTPAFDGTIGRFVLQDSTIAYNTDVGGEAPDCAGVFVDAGGNSIGSRRGCSLFVP